MVDDVDRRLAIEKRQTRRARTIALVFLTIVAFGAILMAATR